MLPTLKEFVQVGVTFVLVTIGWVFFRSESLLGSFDYLNKMIFYLEIPYSHISKIPLVSMFLLIEWFYRFDERNLMMKSKFTLIVELFYFFAIIKCFGSGGEFIYFKF